jgi:hypothetical protein
MLFRKDEQEDLTKEQKKTLAGLVKELRETI